MREPGYYWVRDVDTWEVALWDPAWPGWWQVGSDMCQTKDSYFSEIGERIPDHA